MIEIIDTGNLNQVNVPGENNRCRLQIQIKGSCNQIHISDNAIINGSILVESSNSSVYIDDDVRFQGRVLLKGEGRNCVKIGAKSTFGGIAIICSEGTQVTIGRNCMVSFDVEIRTTDSHAIFDQTTNRRINVASDVTVGDDVWIAAHAKLLKGTKISNGSVVGFGSIVTKEFNESNVVIVGNPAKIIKSKIYWDRKLLG